MNHDHTDHRAIPPAGSDPYDRFAADPFAPTTPAPPVGQQAPTAQPVRHRWWMHLLMCAPMLAVVGFLVATGAAGGGGTRDIWRLPHARMAACAPAGHMCPRHPSHACIDCRPCP